MDNWVINTLGAHVITLRPDPTLCWDVGRGHFASGGRPAGYRGGMSTPATDALDAVGLPYRLIRHGEVSSLTEAAAALGVAVPDVVKTIVVRRGADDHLFVLTPGDRVVSWPKLRALLGVSRLSMPEAAAAREATGYERGTITPFGSTTAWPVIADQRLRGREITLGAGERGLAVAVDADAAIAALGATVADITDLEPKR
jgi:Cys-tRNA(Pro)/Cys-tRNA(Cys) deacylase